MTKLTQEEHRARAMLLGMEYGWMTNTYKGGYDGEPKDSMPTLWLDADTLEPLTRADWSKRYNEYQEGQNAPPPTDRNHKGAAQPHPPVLPRVHRMRG